MSGQVAVGKNIGQVEYSGGGMSLSDGERDELRQLFDALRERVLMEAPETWGDSAAERVGELEEALTAPEPDMETTGYVKRWFLKKLPGLAGLITSLLVHPLVGKLVQSAGDTAYAELVSLAED